MLMLGRVLHQTPTSNRVITQVETAMLKIKKG